MSTPTPRLGLAKPSRSSQFSTAEIASNWQKIDDAPGILVCASSTRPAWGVDHAGMTIFEEDTARHARWTGYSWVQVFPRGILGSEDVVGPVVASSSAPVTIAELDPITCGAPFASNRSLSLELRWYSLGLFGNAVVHIAQTFTAAGGGSPVTSTLNSVYHPALSGVGSGGSLSHPVSPLEGTYVFRAAIYSDPGAVQMNGPITFMAVEV